MSGSFHVVPMTSAHFPEVTALQRLCFPPPFPTDLLWTADHLESHLRRYPQGQFVVLEEECVMASASSLRISITTWQDHADWDSLTGGLDLSGHKADGEVLYGADISVHSDARGRGMARALYEARFELVRREGLLMYGTVCRLPDFAASGMESVEDYAQSIVAGRRKDRTLSPLLRLGLHLSGVQKDVMSDPESGNAAGVLEWRP